MAEVILERPEYKEYKDIFSTNYEICRTKKKSILLPLVGNGGVGKSKTNDYLCNYLDENKIHYARIDFNEDNFIKQSTHSGLLILKKISEKIYDYKEESMIDFYALFNVFANKENKSLMINPEELLNSDAARSKEIKDAAKSTFISIVDFASVLLNSARDEKIEEKFNKKYEKEISEVTGQLGFSALPDVFISLMKEYYELIKKPFVIILDNTETLYNDRIFNDNNRNVLIKLFSKLPNTFWIFSGRNEFKEDSFTDEYSTLNVLDSFKIEGISSELILRLLNEEYKITIDGKAFTTEEVDQLREKTKGNSLWIQLKLAVMNDRFHSSITSEQFKIIINATNKEILTRFLGAELNENLHLKDYSPILNNQAKTLLLYAFVPQKTYVEYDALAGQCNNFKLEPSSAQDSFISIKNDIYYMQPEIEECIRRYVNNDCKNIMAFVNFRGEIENVLLNNYKNNSSNEQVEILGEYISKYSDVETVTKIVEDIKTKEDKHSQIIREQIYKNSNNYEFNDLLFKDGKFTSSEKLAYLYSCYIEFCNNTTLIVPIASDYENIEEFKEAKKKAIAQFKDFKNIYYDFTTDATKQIDLKNEYEANKFISYFENMIDASYALVERTTDQEDTYRDFALTNIISLIMFLKKYGAEDKYQIQRQRFLNYCENITWRSYEDNDYALSFYAEELSKYDEELANQLITYCKNRIANVYTLIDPAKAYITMLNQTLFNLSKIGLEYKYDLSKYRVKLADETLKIIKNSKDGTYINTDLKGLMLAYKAFSKVSYRESHNESLKEIFFSKEIDENCRMIAADIYFEEIEKEKDNNYRGFNFILESYDNHSIEELNTLIGDHYTALLFSFVRELYFDELDLFKLEPKFKSILGQMSKVNDDEDNKTLKEVVDIIEDGINRINIIKAKEPTDEAELKNISNQVNPYRTIKRIYENRVKFKKYKQIVDEILTYRKNELNKEHKNKTISKQIEICDAAINIKDCLYDYYQGKIKDYRYAKCVEDYFKNFNIYVPERQDEEKKLEIICLLTIIYGKIVYKYKTIFTKSLMQKYNSVVNIVSLYQAIKDDYTCGKNSKHYGKKNLCNLVRKICYLDLYEGYESAYLQTSYYKKTYFSKKMIANALLRATSFIENGIKESNATDKIINAKYSKAEFLGTSINFVKLKNDSINYLKKFVSDNKTSALVFTVIAINKMLENCISVYAKQDYATDPDCLYYFFSFVSEPLFIIGQNVAGNENLKNVAFDNIGDTISRYLNNNELKNGEIYYWRNLSRMVYTLGRIQTNQDSAITILEMMLTLSDNSLITYQFHKNIAKTILSLEDPNKDVNLALDNYKKAIELAKNNSDYRELSNLYDDVHSNSVNYNIDCKVYLLQQLSWLNTLTANDDVHMLARHLGKLLSE